MQISFFRRISWFEVFQERDPRKCWQCPISLYRRASRFRGVPDKSGTLCLVRIKWPCSCECKSWFPRKKTKTILTTPTPHISKIYAPNICHKMRGRMAYKSFEIKGLSQRIWCTNRLLWHTNSNFYGIRTPTVMPYEPFFIGGPEGPAIDKIQSRSKMSFLAWKFQSRSKFSISIEDFNPGVFIYGALLVYREGLDQKFQFPIDRSKFSIPKAAFDIFPSLGPLLETNLASRWEGVRLPRASGKSPNFPRSSPDFPEVLSLWDLTAIQGFPGSSPDFPASSPDFPGSFPDFPGGQPLSLGSLTPSLDSQKSGVAPANQTKERSVHELFTGAFRNKSSMWIVLVFLRKNTRIHKNGRNSWTFRFGPFFGLVCRGDSWKHFLWLWGWGWSATYWEKQNLFWALGLQGFSKTHLRFDAPKFFSSLWFKAVTGRGYVRDKSRRDFLELFLPFSKNRKNWTSLGDWFLYTSSAERCCLFWQFGASGV